VDHSNIGSAPFMTEGTEGDVTKAGDNTMTGQNTFTNFLFSLLTPTLPTQVVHKEYADGLTNSLLAQIIALNYATQAYADNMATKTNYPAEYTQTVVNAASWTNWYTLNNAPWESVKTRTNDWDNTVAGLVALSNNWYGSVAYLITSADTNRWNAWLNESNQYTRAATEITINGQTGTIGTGNVFSVESIDQTIEQSNNRTNKQSTPPLQLQHLNRFCSF
jgi:hypothetical protein